jgi:c-di-AMP phosphodiesterase-like protein
VVYIIDEISYQYDFEVHNNTELAALYLAELYNKKENKKTIETLNRFILNKYSIANMRRPYSVNQNNVLTDDQVILNFSNLPFAEQIIYIKSQFSESRLKEIAEQTKDHQIEIYLDNYKFLEDHKEKDKYIKISSLLLVVICLFILISITTYILPLIFYRVYYWIRSGFLTQ